jgi:hypothetical protein
MCCLLHNFAAQSSVNLSGDVAEATGHEQLAMLLAVVNHSGGAAEATGHEQLTMLFAARIQMS